MSLSGRDIGRNHPLLLGGDRHRGKSIPKMGATGFAYRIAEAFGLPLIETRPGLVPLTLDPAQLETLSGLAGVAVDIEARSGKAAFEEAMLITHRGLSGPAILQISSYWREGGEIGLNLLPALDFAALLKAARRANGRQALQTALSEWLPKRLAQFFVESAGLSGRALADLADRTLDAFASGSRPGR